MFVERHYDNAGRTHSRTRDRAEDRIREIRGYAATVGASKQREKMLDEDRQETLSSSQNAQNSCFINTL